MPSRFPSFLQPERVSYISYEVIQEDDRPAIRVHPVVAVAMVPAHPDAPLTPVVDVELEPRDDEDDDSTAGDACSSWCGYCGRCTTGGGR